ncbi:hypothetical protein [Lachnoclostridium sp. Marseille-P6806]|nr:hypothetical protein [Lachnoclostridium sp. Marseille-P6806]
MYFFSELRYNSREHSVPETGAAVPGFFIPASNEPDERICAFTR